MREASCRTVSHAQPLSLQLRKAVKLAAQQRRKKTFNGIGFGRGDNYNNSRELDYAGALKRGRTRKQGENLNRWLANTNLESVTTRPRWLRCLN